MIIKKKNPPTFIVMLIWQLTLLLTVWIIHNSVSSDVSEKVKDAELVLSSTASKLEYSVNSRLLNLRTLEVLVQHDGGMLCDFENHASRIYEADPCVRCLQLAPNGVVTHVYPREGNENAYGNLFVNSLRRSEARHARDCGEMTMGGPYDLHQGGVGMVARRPIYMNTDSGESFFWGVAIEVMDLPLLLETAELLSLTENGYSYRLWHYASQTGEPTVFAGEEHLPDAPITAEITVPGGVWYLSMVPTGGWLFSQTWKSGFAFLFAFNLLSLLLSNLIIQLFGARDKLKRMAETDSLTGLGNSRSFYDELKRLPGKNARVFLYYMDLNKFKEINDNYGHGVGNTLLRSVAQRIQDATTDPATEIYRIGGDEFAMIKPGTDPAEAQAYKKELFDALLLPFSMEGQVMPISASIGFAGYPAESIDAKRVLRLAESRMYEDKARAFNPVALNNRTAFFRALGAMIDEALSQNADQAFYFFHIDFKDFKLFNYVYGVAAGDALVQRTVSFINAIPKCMLCSRGSADSIFFVARESAFVSHDMVAARFRSYCEMFTADVQKDFPDVCIACNCGFSQILDKDIEAAAGCANVGRLASKQRLSEAPLFVDRQYVDAWMKETALESSILLALRQNRFRYELQPIVSATDGKMVLAEALGRMRDRNGERIPADIFIPILTKTGDIVQFDMCILESVCRDLRERIDAGEPVVPISVNLSPLHFEDAHLTEKIRDILERYRISSNLICLELTENLRVHDMEKTMRRCQELRGIGIRILLDDFGDGYLNFEMLNLLPVDMLKIDRSLISSEAYGLYGSSSILARIFSIAADLHISTICEGVETADQAQSLCELGADFLQGFYFARPTKPDDIYRDFL